MSLDEQQVAAARRLGQDVCVDAGPGAGKTRVLVERFVWLVEVQRVLPRRILAITFTEKAAGEIKRRLVERFSGDVKLRREIEQAYVSTIHAFCARLLRENAIAAGVDFGFDVLDQSEADGLLDEAAERALEELYAARPDELARALEFLYVSTSPFSPQLDLARALQSVYRALRAAARPIAELGGAPAENPLPAFTELLRRVEGLLRDSGWRENENRRAKREELRRWLDRAARVHDAGEALEVLNEFDVDLRGLPRDLASELKQLREESLPRLMSALAGYYYRPQRALLIEALKQIEAGYLKRKRAAGALDFADLEERTLELLERRPEIAERVAGQFEFILMDELQDTNPLQWRILERIRRPGRFFGVGDVNQSIYGFRHAEPELFLNYRLALQRAGQKIDELRANYRSRQQILDAAAALLDGAPGIEPRQLRARRTFPPKDVPSVEVIVAAGDGQEQAEPVEASWIGRRILELLEELPIGFAGMAVLARKVEGLTEIERALREFGIPALVIGGRTLLETREVLDVWNFLRVIANTQDEVALAGVLRSPLVGVSDETILRLKFQGSLWGALSRLEESGVDQEDRERLEWFLSLARALRRERDGVSPDLLAARIVDESGYLSLLAPHSRRNLEKFFGLLEELHFRRRRPLAETLLELEWRRAAEAASEAPPAEAADAVRLMTVHAAKGLEFPVVFVARLHQAARDSLDPIAFSPRHGFGAKWRLPRASKGVPDPIYKAAEQELKQKSDAEEMRLLYVAMTRAEEHLVLSYSTGERSPGSLWSKQVAAKAGLSKNSLEEADSVGWIGGVRVRRIVSRQRQAPSCKWVASALAEPAELSPPVRTGQHDSSAAVTDVGEYLACPRRYFLGRYLALGAKPRRGLIEPGEEAIPEEASDVDGTELGSQVHALLAGASVSDATEEALRLARVFERSELARRLERARRVEREFDFAIELEQVVLRGQIDLWFEEGGEIVVVDYKTGTAEAGPRVEAYELQLRVYALALERLTGRLPDRALLFFLETGEPAEVTLDAPALEQARAQVRALRQAQDRLEFPLREGAHCWSCAWLGRLCPARPASAARAR